MRILLLLCLVALPAWAQKQRIYTVPDAQATGQLEGTLPVGELTHALAVDSERVKVFRGSVISGSNRFVFEHLPVGKYDIVLVTKERRIYEGLRLGEPGTSLTSGLRANLEKRIGKADEFFNRSTIHRIGIDGERALAFVERVRDKGDILKQSGESLGANLRRLEIIELDQATDDWQMISSRHIYREEEPIVKGAAFCRSAFVPELSAVRVVDRAKELGNLTLPKEN